MGTTSHWHSISRTVEVIVIGAGIAGVSASRELARRRIDHLVLERGVIGCGASTRNAGYLMRGAADNYAAAIRQFGRDKARALWHWAEDNLQDLRDAGVESLRSYERRPSCLLALEEQELAQLRESLDLLGQDGFDATWQGEGTDTLWESGRALGGLLNPHDAVCNPAELIRWLAQPVFEHIRQGVEVLAIESADDAIALRTSIGPIRARRVLVCMNAYAPMLLPALASRIAPNRGQMLALDAPGVRLDCAYYINHGHEYIRMAEAGVVVVGGCRGLFADQEQRDEDATSPNVQTAIEDFACEMLGTRHRVITRWVGTMGFSTTDLPVIMPLDASDRRIWYCGGFTGHGMSLAYRTAAAAVGAMLDDEQSLFTSEP